MPVAHYISRRNASKRVLAGRSTDQRAVEPASPRDITSPTVSVDRVTGGRHEGPGHAMLDSCWWVSPSKVLLVAAASPGRHFLHFDPIRSAALGPRVSGGGEGPSPHRLMHRGAPHSQ
jgi:hypothetical protein